MRLVHPREGAPDVRVMYLESSGPSGSNRMMTLQVEVATLTLHSSAELGEFIFNKKLDPTKKAYASNTAILIHVQRGCTPQDIQAAHEYLADKGGRQSCYLVGMLTDRRWQVAPVAPNLRGPVTVDLAEALESEQASQFVVRCYRYTFTRYDAAIERLECPPGPPLVRGLVKPFLVLTDVDARHLTEILDALSPTERVNAGAVQLALAKAYAAPAVVWAAKSPNGIDMEVRAHTQCILATLPTVGPARVSPVYHGSTCTGG
jgi:hypothetical protein